MNKRTLNSILFPKLSDAQIAKIEKFAQLKLYRDGEIVAEVSDRNFCFFVIKSGKMAIIDCSSYKAQFSPNYAANLARQAEDCWREL